MISKLAGDSTWSKYSLGWSGIQALVIVALESVIFNLHWKESKSIQAVIEKIALEQVSPGNGTEGSNDAAMIVQSTRVLSVYHVLFIVAQVFQLILLCDAMFHKNTIQIMAIVAFNCAMVAYAGVQVKQASDILVRTEDPSLVNMVLDLLPSSTTTPYHASLPYEIAVLAMMIVLATGFAFIAYKLYKEFGWTIYKKIGADLAMRDMYKVYQIFIMILKFDIFFQLGFSAQFLCVVVLQDQSNVYTPDRFKLTQDQVTSILVTHLILSTGASILLPLLCWFALKRESKIAMGCAIAGGLAMLVYNIIKLNQVVEENLRFVGAIKFLKFFLIVNIVLGMATIYLAWACMRNFNHGLNAHIGKVSGTNIYPMESVSGSAKRWSIE